MNDIDQLNKAVTRHPLVLLVANEIPYPADTGGRRDTYERLRHLNGLGYRIHLIVAGKDPVPTSTIEHLSEFVERIDTIPRKRGVLQSLSLRPFQHASRLQLSEIKLNGKYAMTILEGEYTAAVLSNPTLSRGILVIRIHNNEAAFYKSLASVATTLKSKLFYLLEAFKFQRYSGRIFRKADALWFISSDELAAFRSSNPSYAGKAFFLPISVDASRFQHQALTSRSVLYIGDLSLATNRESVLWYLDHVHPTLSREIKDYRFLLAGKTGGSLPASFRERVDRTQNLTFSPDAPSLQHLYASASVFINPIRRGAGLKIKTIDAISAGVPVVTTTVGSEGSGLVSGEHVIIADDPAEFTKAILSLLHDKAGAHNMAVHAQNYVKEMFGPSRLEQLMLELVR